MASPVSADQANLFFEHLATLRQYAQRVFVNQELLNPNEQADKLTRMREFLDVGELCEFTERHLVILVLGDLF